MEWLFFFVIIAVVIIGFIFLGIQRTKSVYPYMRGQPLFTPAEQHFYQSLVQAVGVRGLVFAKVRIADVLMPKKNLDRSQWQQAFNKIACKHFDYVLCKKDDFSVMVVIELNDRSHNKPRRRKRDIFVRGACKTAGIQLCEFAVQRHYKIEQIRSILFPS